MEIEADREVALRARLEALAVEAREIAGRREEASNPDDREVIDRQCREVEHEIERLRRWLHRAPRAARVEGDAATLDI